MKTLIKIILALIWLLIFSLILCNLDSTLWKIVLSVFWCLVLWIVVELYRAKPMPKEYDEFDEKR